MTTQISDHEITIAANGTGLPGDLRVPEGARGLIIFAHGSGSGRNSPRNQQVAGDLRESGVFGTLLFDLLTEEEDRTYANRFDIDLLAQRLIATTRWAHAEPSLRELPVGYFGASTGSAAAIIAAANLPEVVQAVVSRGGRPDLAGTALTRLRTPTLLIVGGLDVQVIALNVRALEVMPTPDKHMEIVPEATHLFEEPGALDEVGRLAQEWFGRYVGIAA